MVLPPKPERLTHVTGALKAPKPLPESIQNPPVLSPLEMLDVTLLMFKHNKDRKIAWGDVWENTAGMMIVSIPETNAIVKKLTKDGYLEEFEIKEGVAMYSYQITFEGLVFD